MTGESLKLSDLFSKEKLKKFLRKILHLNVTSERIALSIALGVLIGLSLPIGFQTIFAVPIAVMFQCNIVLTMSATLVSNPLTVVPLYYVSFRIGELLTGLELSSEKFWLAVNHPTWENLTNMGGDALILFFSGSVLQGIFFGIISYYLSLYLVKWYREKKGITIN